jgi:HlyD family secretion protein
MSKPWQTFTLLIFLSATAGCSRPPGDLYQGYVEGEFLQVAAPLAGQLEVLPVERGMTVTAGEPLFSLEHSLESAELAEAEEGLARATSQLADLTKGLRPTEIKAIQARLAQARAAHELARKEYERLENLVKTQTVSRDSYDRAASELQRASARVDELSAELETAGLGGRNDAVAAARAQVKSARERVRQARWKLAQKSQAAPAAGLVFDTFYVQGEFVPAGYPVVSLLPPGRVKLRFFVPETVVGTLKIGGKIRFTFDGAKNDSSATISYVSPKAEYTPPGIYSRETRSKLVFMLEAVPEPGLAAKLHPGQPVDVRLGLAL